MTFATVYYGSALYHLSLFARAPLALQIALPKPWPGDAERGEALVHGEFRFAGEAVQSAMPPWDGAHDLRPDYEAALHSFNWLVDLLAVGGADSNLAAGEWTRNWIEHCDAWSPVAWRAHVLADRLVAWTEHFHEIARDDEFRARLLASYARQTRHLARRAGEMPGLKRLAAQRGLIVASLALGQERRAERAVTQFLREIDAQIRRDGGHVERSPRAQFWALRYLIDARDALRAAEIEVPGELQSAIDRATPMLRFFRHGDGRLALFNGSSENDAAAIDLVLARADAKGKAPTSAPYIGFQRLQTGRCIVLMDAGAPPPSGLDRDAHAGTLSFEMSYGKERLIVNCGAYHGPSADWRALTRGTAAHSTLVVGDTHSAEIKAHGGIGRRARQVTCERAEDQGSQWLEATHNGYQHNFGLVHSRQLFLVADGDDLRGEEKLTGRAGTGFAVRFHLHPAVQVSLIQDGAAALLRLPGGIGWRLRAQGAVMSIAESVYLGTETVRKTQQIVLDGHVGTGGAVVKWALKREQQPKKLADKAPEKVDADA